MLKITTLLVYLALLFYLAPESKYLCECDSKEVYRLFLVNCYLLHVPRLPSQPASIGRVWVIDFIWLELPWQYIAMTRNNLSIILNSLLGISQEVNNVFSIGIILLNVTHFKINRFLFLPPRCIASWNVFNNCFPPFYLFFFYILHSSNYLVWKIKNKIFSKQGSNLQNM